MLHLEMRVAERSLAEALERAFIPYGTHAHKLVAQVVTSEEQIIPTVIEAFAELQMTRAEDIDSLLTLDDYTKVELKNSVGKLSSANFISVCRDMHKYYWYYIGFDDELQKLVQFYLRGKIYDKRYPNSKVCVSVLSYLLDGNSSFDPFYFGLKRYVMQSGFDLNKRKIQLSRKSESWWQLIFGSGKTNMAGRASQTAALAAAGVIAATGVSYALYRKTRSRSKKRRRSRSALHRH